MQETRKKTLRLIERGEIDKQSILLESGTTYPTLKRYLDGQKIWLSNKVKIENAVERLVELAKRK